MKLSNKTILVTGNFGFLGKNICRYLINKNVNVIGVDNLSQGTKDETIRDICFYEDDVTNRKIFEKLKKHDIDYIFHLASPSSVILYNRNPIECFNTTIDSFLNILTFAKNNGVKKIVYPSSGSVYGKAKPPQKETDLPQPLNLYAVAKLACENIAKCFPDVEVVFLRIFAGYGPFEDHKKDFASPLTLFLNSIMNNERPIVFGDGKQARDFVYVDDVIKAFVNSLKLEGNYIINVGSGRSYSFNFVIQTINEMLGKNLKPVYVKKPVNYLEKTHADIKLMQKLLKIEPLDLRSGLKKYLEFLKGE
jgi:UDP-glucose 4-epimerase